jgi:hypothetical protein
VLRQPLVGLVLLSTSNLPTVSTEHHVAHLNDYLHQPYQTQFALVRKPAGW